MSGSDFTGTRGGSHYLGANGKTGEQLPAEDQPEWPGWRVGVELTPLEQEMRAKAEVGDLVDRGEGPFDLADMQGWGQERAIRAAVLRYVLAVDDWPVDAKGIRLRGVRISGPLDLEGVTLRCALLLEACYLDADKPVCLDHATAPRLALTRCQLAGLTGDTLSAREVNLKGSTLTGPLQVQGAEITGQLNCRDAKLTGQDEDGQALVAFRMKLGADLLLDEKFTASGAIFLRGADITGYLSCTGAQLTGTDNNGNALSADGMKVGGDVFFDEKFTASGAIFLRGADITGYLSCTGAQLTGTDNSGNALFADGMKVGGDVYFDEKFTASGAIFLRGADITGYLSCRGAQLTGTGNDGRALSADGMKVGGDVYFDRKFTAAGPVWLRGADIKGQLSCRGAKLTGRNEYDYALFGETMKVGGDVFLDQGFTAAGPLSLHGADIKGELRCRGAELTGRNQDGNALFGEGMKVGEDVLLDQGFTAAGTISLRSARVDGSMLLCPAALAGQDETALDAAQAQITGRLVWAPTVRVVGRVNLEGAACGHLEDDWGHARPGGFWPAEGQLRLDGFTYDRFGGDHQATVGQRLEWIRSQYQRSGKSRQGFAAQPYEQLAAVYRRAGQDSQARKVAIARRADLRKYGNLAWYRRFGNWFLEWSIGYGYRTWQAGLVLVGVFVAIAVLASFAQQHHLMVPVGDTDALHFVPSVTRCTSSYPCFSPVGYAVDTVIPLISVHQADFWGPNAHTILGHAWASATRAATVLGWALVTLLLAGYTGIVRRD